jgi:hypothetical protein
MSRLSTLNRSIIAATAGLLFVGQLSPANATYQHDSLIVFPDLPISTIADHGDTKQTNSPVARNRSIVLTSHLPWLAPVGHRQPHRADVPQSEAVSAWERQQHEFDQTLDRKLIICRRC